MGKYCYVCKKWDYQGEPFENSYHKFPNDPYKRSIWISRLGYDERHMFPKLVFICSKHFNANDFYYGPVSGRRCLKKDAVPNNISSTTSVSPAIAATSFHPKPDVESGRQESVIKYNSLQSSSCINKLKCDDEKNNYGFLDSSTGVMRVPPFVLVLNVEKTNTDNICPTQMEHSIVTTPSPSSVSTITASTPDADQVVNPYTSDLNSAVPKQKSERKKRKKQYIREFRLLRRTIFAQRKKIHSLQTIALSLRQRVKTLHGSLKELIDEAHVAESVKTVLKSLQCSKLKVENIELPEEHFTLKTEPESPISNHQDSNELSKMITEPPNDYYSSKIKGENPETTQTETPNDHASKIKVENKELDEEHLTLKIEPDSPISNRQDLNELSTINTALLNDHSYNKIKTECEETQPEEHLTIKLEPLSPIQNVQDLNELTITKEELNDIISNNVENSTS